MDRIDNNAVRRMLNDFIFCNNAQTTAKLVILNEKRPIYKV